MKRIELRFDRLPRKKKKLMKKHAAEIRNFMESDEPIMLPKHIRFIRVTK